MRWTLEIEELGTLVQRVWLAGKDNILGDAPSRNPIDRDHVKDLPIPAGPVKRVVRAMFEAPMQFEEEFTEFTRFLDQLESTEPDLPKPNNEQPSPAETECNDEKRSVTTIQILSLFARDAGSGFSGDPIVSEKIPSFTLRWKFPRHKDWNCFVLISSSEGLESVIEICAS